MLRASFLSVALLAAVAVVCPAQRIPRTIEAAEAEGARYPRGATPDTVAEALSRTFAGTESRRCVAPPAEVPEGGGFVRSGDFVVSWPFGGPEGARARRDTKVLWTPLHNPYVYQHRGGLLVRGARIGHPTDTLRFSVARAAYPGTRMKRIEAGYPSLVRFPAAGDWLVVASAGADWGCFRLTVAA